MRRFDWNALRVGDRVVAHDPAGADFSLLTGTVAMVDASRSKRGAALDSWPSGKMAVVTESCGRRCWQPTTTPRIRPRTVGDAPPSPRPPSGYSSRLRWLQRRPGDELGVLDRRPARVQAGHRNTG